MPGKVIVCGIAAVTGIAVIFSPIKPVLINVTPSIPVGIYVRTFTTPRKGSVVALNIPREMLPIMGAIDPTLRDFLERRPLMKVVAATGGDVICRSDGGTFSAGGHVIGPAFDRINTRHGAVTMPKWTGCRTLNDGEIAVGSGDDVLAVDSRYWGTTPASEARSYMPLWIKR